MAAVCRVGIGTAFRPASLKYNADGRRVRPVQSRRPPSTATAHRRRTGEIACEQRGRWRAGASPWRRWPLGWAAAARRDAAGAGTAGRSEGGRIARRDRAGGDEFVGRIAAYRSVEVRARVEGILRSATSSKAPRSSAATCSIRSTRRRTASRSTMRRPNRRARRPTWRAPSHAKPRLAPLVKENAISRQDYDDAVTAVKQNEALLAVAAANIERAQTNLGYTASRPPSPAASAPRWCPKARLVGKGEATHLPRSTGSIRST